MLGKADRMLYLGLTCVAAFFVGNLVVARGSGGPVRLFDALLGAFTALALLTSIQRVRAIHKILGDRRG
jgi:hypothetical protein